MTDIEYEWQPPRCDTCKIFDHNDDQCPKMVKVLVPSKPLNVNGKAFTSQPNVNKEPSTLKPNNKGKDMSDLQEINVFSFQNSFDALTEKDKKIEVNNESLKASNDVGSIMDDSDSEKVKKVL
uniref:Zinc knuckle CX2CX4HX4C n=1 Tax=Tanacetum cinerariifolium TaxID=118510 RepID=A0A699IQT7_TANCI|nr:zinc knuckle CX2CX4HX4C [Tanacetum cinerariifolium]